MKAEQTKAITEQQNPMNPELANQLITLFKQPKIQVKYGSLNAILQYTKSQEAKKMFVGSELFSEMNKVINNQKMTKLCLSTLINFSSCAELQKQFVRFVEPLVFNLKQWKDDLRQELALLVLLNITKFDSVIETLIGEGQKRGFLLQVLYGFMEIKQVRRWVITNIYVNLTSIEIGRKFVGQQKIYLRFLDYINAEKQAVRLGVLKILRNVSFQWEVEEFVQQILKPEHDVINRLAEHLAYLIIVSNISPQTNNEDVMKILKDYQPVQKESKNIINKMKVASKEKALAEVCLVVDIFLILSNANFAERKVSLKQLPMKEILSILRFTELSDEYKDKLEALEIFCFN